MTISDTEEKIKTAEEIYQFLGITAKKESIEALENLLINKKVSFNEENEEFVYHLYSPINLADGSKIESLTVREAYGSELVKIGDFNHHFKVSMDILAIQNGISSEILGRAKMRDIVNLTTLLAIFT